MRNENEFPDVKLNSWQKVKAKRLVKACLILQAVTILHEAGIDVPISERLERTVDAGLEAVRMYAQNPVARRNPIILAEFYANYLKACFTPEEPM